jgi:hypothetical protein
MPSPVHNGGAKSECYCCDQDSCDCSNLLCLVESNEDEIICINCCSC